MRSDSVHLCVWSLLAKATIHHHLVHATDARCWDCADRSWWLEPGYHLSYMEDNPPYPFQRIKKVDGKDTGVLAIIAPFYDLDYYKVLSPSFDCGRHL